MASSNGNGKRPLLLDHLGRKPTSAEERAAIDKQIAEQIAAIAEAKAVEVAQFYAQQLPGIVATMIGQILHANGMELKPPPEWRSIAAPNGVQDDETVQ